MLAREGERKRMVMGGQLLLMESVTGVELVTRLTIALRDEMGGAGVRGRLAKDNSHPLNVASSYKAFLRKLLPS